MQNEWNNINKHHYWRYLDLSWRYGSWLLIEVCSLWADNSKLYHVILNDAVQYTNIPVYCIGFAEGLQYRFWKAPKMNIEISDYQYRQQYRLILVLYRQNSKLFHNKYIQKQKTFTLQISYQFQFLISPSTSDESTW